MTTNRSALVESQEERTRRPSVAPFLARFAILADPDGSPVSTRITRVARETTDDE